MMMEVIGESFDDRMDRQQQLEDHCLGLGITRFRRRVEQAQQHGQGATVGAARKLLQMAIEPMTQAIVGFVEQSKTTRGAKHVAVRWCEMVGAEVAAFITVKVMLDGLALRQQFRDTALNIADMLSDELRYRRFREVAPGLFKYRMNKFNTNSYVHMARSLDAVFNMSVCDECRAAGLEECIHMDVSDLKLPTSQRLLVGTKLIDLCMASTGLVTVEQETTQRSSRSRPKTETFLVPTPETLEWLSIRNGVLETLWPVNLPMLVPPLPWGPEGQQGGYRFGLRGKHPLVRRVSAAQQQVIHRTSMPTVYSAVNRIQETPWKINPDVYALVMDIMERGGGLAGIPKLTQDELPVQPDDISTNEVARKEWRRAAAKIHEENHCRKRDSLTFLKTMSTAQAVRDEAMLFFPYNLDFRGRVYPLTNYLTPQGDDLSKALLCFAQGKPLGEDGASALAIHGANCMGETPEGVKLTKATLQERVDWIVQHTNAIEQVAASPLDDRWWMAADDPLQFFAFCCEWAAFAKLQRQGMGEEFVSSLPCAMDGTNNGLQHFSAMLRDPVGAVAVNVAPNERPEDIYQHVADKVLGLLEAQAVDNDLAHRWLTSGLVKRSLTKRPTMTYVYGSERYGFAEQLHEYLKGLENWDEVQAHFRTVNPATGLHKSLIPMACTFMAECIWQALWATVVAASHAMAWLQAAARCVVQNGQMVRWTVPETGFPVVQEYTKDIKKQIKTILAGKIIQPVVMQPTKQPNAIKQANAIAPNVVHSLDAAALMMTVEAAAADGVECFAMVHDSYATHAADYAVLGKATRECFYGLYTRTDVLAHLEQHFKALAKPTAQFPVRPAFGTLDLGGVLVSDYFFS